MSAADEADGCRKRSLALCFTDSTEQHSDRRAAAAELQPGDELLLFARDISDKATSLGEVAPVAVAAAERGVEITLAVAEIEEDRELEEALRAVPVAVVEVRFEAADAHTIEAARALADRLDASLRVGFLLTPSTWFDFDQAATCCTSLGTAIRFRVFDADSAAPLAAASARAVRFVTEAIIAARALDRETRPPQVASALETLCDDLGALLRAKWDESPDAAGNVKISLPPSAHPLYADASSRNWWLKLLFAHLHCDQICDAILDLASCEPLEELDWLRQLVHAIAATKHRPAALELLGGIYASPSSRALRIDEDEKFVASYDVSDVGGPWAAKLGIDARPPRVRPFEIQPLATTQPAQDVDTTVLIPSYKHEDYVEDAMRSVLGQTFGAFKLLVVDDGSPDDTVARAQAVTDPRVEVRVNDQNLGLGNSVLAALRSVDTPYVALLNSDDLLHPQRLERCRALLEDDPDAMLVTTDLTLIDSDDCVLTPENVSLVLDGNLVYDWVHWYRDALAEADLVNKSPRQLFTALLRRNFLATSSNIVARREWLLRQAESLQSLKYCLDWQLFLEAASEGSLRHIAEPLAAYRLHRSNTVWFQAEKRWSYYLEVNRVATEALLRFHTRSEHGSLEQLRATLAALAHGLAQNNETDGLAMLMNALVDRVSLENIAAEDETTRALVQNLSGRPRDALGPEASATPSDATPPTTRSEADALRNQLSFVRLDLQHARDDVHRLHQANVALYADQRDRISRAKEQDQRIRDLYQDQQERATRAEHQDQQIRSLYQDQQQRITRAEDHERLTQELYADQRERIAKAAKQDRQLRELYRDQKERIGQAEKQEQRVQALFEDQQQRIKRASALEQRLSDLHKDLQQRIARAETLETRLQDVRQEAHTAQQDLKKLRRDLADADAALQQKEQEMERELDAKGQRIKALSADKQDLRRQGAALRGEVNALNSEITRLLATREYRLGNLLWNKLPLGRISRMSKKWYQRLFNLKARAKIKRRSSRQHEGAAVVAACWQWPIYSHTFVYQEMVSLRQTGLDVQLFHWDLGSTDQLHKAFQYLYDNRTQLQPEWTTHQKDKEHFEQTRPGRLRSFLERISPLCGKSVEELENAPIVMQACTFARMAELANARYLHSYFFYDQSFMAMLAAWLLELPRGVSCYADHMMDDYEFKFVPLHIELADVVIATSARIKRELSELSGGKYDDKIVVKPNGVDGERFPPRQRPPRSADEPFEVLSVSRIEPKKGLTHLVEAMAELKRRGHTVIAHIIGSEDPNSAGSVEYAQMFERCIAEHDLQDQVILHGMMKQEEMPPIIEKCRAFVAPYVETESGDKDGIPTAMLEALASSLPIITTDSGSIVEVVDDGVEGIVVAQRDSMAYAEALAKVIADPKLEQQMAAAARARFDRDFDIQVTEKRLHERIHGFLEAKE